MTFHVYIDRPTDPSPGGVARLAAAMSARFRLAEDQVSTHLAAGRLRVKSGVDEATARAFARELEALGAVVSIENATTGLSLSTRPPGSGTYESGLAAAFSGKARQVSLGALERVDVEAEAPPPLTLGTLDGAEDAPPPPPPPPPPPAGTAKVGKTSPPLDVGVAPLPRPSSEPENRFAPPEEKDAPLELADSPARPTRPPRSAAQPAVAPPAPSRPSASHSSTRPPASHAHTHDSHAHTHDSHAHTHDSHAHTHDSHAHGRDASTSAHASHPPAHASHPPAHASHPPAHESHAPAHAAHAAHAAPSLKPVGGGSTTESSRPLARLFEGKPRQRLLVGLALGLFLGFGVANLYASSAEGRYAELRRTGEFAVAPANQDEYQHQLAERDAAIEAMGKAKTRIVISSAVMWILVGAGVSIVFFRFLA